MRALLAFIAVIPVFTLQACFETYCQAGRKGTQCVTGAELEAEKRSQGREEPPSESTRMVRPPWSPPPTAQQSTGATQRGDAGLTWRPGLGARPADAGPE